MKETDYKEIIKQNLSNVLLSGFIPELGTHRSGKVRDLHFTSEKLEEPFVMIASDRISAFDYILDRCIPFKGQVLNLLNQWAFQNTQDIIPNASLPSPHPNVLIQRYYQNIKVECVVRGYVWGTLAAQYETGKRNFCGHHLPEGLFRYQKLPKPLFTPTTKTEHDSPLTFLEVEQLLGSELAAQVQDVSLRLYQRGVELAEKVGLIFLDTKYEFGLDSNGQLQLIDEANTPDSSRYCLIAEYHKFAQIEKEMASGQFKDVTELIKVYPFLKIKEMSKQFIRDVLVEKGFSYSSSGKPPCLTDDDVLETSYRYIVLYEQLTGQEFPFPKTNLKQDLLEKLRSSGLIKGGLILIIAGSDSDLFHVQKIKEALQEYSLKVQVQICSAHKQASACEKLIKKYNLSLQPVVIITVAGGTDALSGLVSFHSIHPVISCPPVANDYSSCLSNPSLSSNSLILNPKNVARHAAQILGLSDDRLRTILLKNNAEKIKKLEEANQNLN